MNAAMLEKQALLLPDHERAILVDRLIGSLSSASQERQNEWLREADIRFDAFCNGELVAVDGGKAMSELRAKFPR